MLEGQWRGAGAAGPAGCAAYALGCHELTEQLARTVSVIANLVDPSALIVASLRYDVAESVDLGIGAFGGVRGSRADVAPGRFESERGAHGHLIDLDLAAWF